MTNRSVSNVRKVLRPYTRSLHFDGVNDFATVPITPSTSGFCMSFWIYMYKFISAGTNSHYISYQDADGTSGFKILHTTSRRLFFLTYTTSNIGSVSIDDFVLGWNHVTVTWKSDSLKIYLNSVLKNTDTSASMDAPTGQLLTLGKRSYIATYVEASFSEFCFQNTITPWTQSQIEDLYYRGIFPSGSSFYSLDGNVLNQNGENSLTLAGTNYIGDRPC